MSRKDEFGRELQVDAKKSTRKLYQLEEVLQLTPGRFESAISEAPALSKFSEQVGKYMGALLNSYGGIVRWGVTRTGLAKVKVIGTHCDRKMEDEYKVVVDCVAKDFSPRIDPSLYRLDFVQILRKSTNQPFREIRVIELRVQAGQELLYMDQEQRVRVVNGSTLYGPLIPQEIKRLVLKKYRKELLDSQSLLDVITPLVGRPLRAAVTPLLDRPPSGVSVDTQTSPAFCHGNGGNNSNVQATPIQSHINKSKVACLGTPMPSHIATSMVHSATPMQNHGSKNNACSITPMHAHVGNSKMSSPIETPKQNLQTALETSICTPFVGKESSSRSDITEGCVDLSESVAAEPKQNLQSVLETSAGTPSVVKRSSSRAETTESCENVSEKPLAEKRHTDTQNSPKLVAKKEKLSSEGEDVAQDEDARQGQDETTSEGQDVPKDATQDAEIPIIDLTGESPGVSRRRDSVGTFAHKLLEESLDAKKPSKTESESKENENPTGKETGSTGNSKTSLAERVKTFLQDVKQKIRPNTSKEEDTCPGKGSKVLKAEGNVKVKVGKKEEESERKRKQPAQRPALQNKSQNQNRSSFTLTYHNQLYNQSYNQQSCNQQSYNQQTYNQRSYNQPRTNQTYNQQTYNQQQSYSHLLQTAFSRNQAQSYNQTDQYQMSFVARQFSNGSQGRNSSNVSGFSSQNRYASSMDWHNFYRQRQQAAIRDAWRSSYHD